MPAHMTYSTPEQMQEQVDCFFDNELTPTLGELATFLGLSYKTFLTYGEREGFDDVIEKARARSEAFIEKGALRGDLNATFSIFALKNRFGWKDKHEVETKLSGTLSLSALLAAADEIALPMGADKANAIEAHAVS